MQICSGTDDERCRQRTSTMKDNELDQFGGVRRASTSFLVQPDIRASFDFAVCEHLFTVLSLSPHRTPRSARLLPNLSLSLFPFYMFF
jgi:hypothetical protein